MRQGFLVNAIAAILALGLAYAYWQGVEPVSTVSKFRLSIDAETIEPGTSFDDLVDSGLIEAVAIPVSNREGAVRASDFNWAIDANAANRIALEGRLFTQSVQPGAFLEERFFAELGAIQISDRLRDGHQLFTFEVNDAHAVARFIVPGSFVDVVGLVDQGSGIQARNLLERVEILAVGDITTAEEYRLLERPRIDTVTVQARPEEIRAFLELQSQSSDLPSLILTNGEASASGEATQ